MDFFLAQIPALVFYPYGLPAGPQDMGPGHAVPLNALPRVQVQHNINRLLTEYVASRLAQVNEQQAQQAIFDYNADLENVADLRVVEVFMLRK